MSPGIDQKLGDLIVDKAVSLGASLAGLVSGESVRNAPSYQASKDVYLSEDIQSFIVMALEHGEKDLYLDWWDGNLGTEGNRQLIRISRRLKKWLKKTYGITAYDSPYFIQKGGVFLKDAAVLAGLGVIGKNNLLITQQFGPRVRLHALCVNAIIEQPTFLLDFSPCVHCHCPCMTACPQNAFQSGKYDWRQCKIQLEKDEKDNTALKNTGTMYYGSVCIKYCRKCELACPVGKI
jgi:epoxyqueuosine reductase